MKQVLAALNDVIATLEEDDLTVEAAAVQEVFERLAMIEEEINSQEKSKQQPKNKK